jgi:hypothetical protein
MLLAELHGPGGSVVSANVCISKKPIGWLAKYRQIGRWPMEISV